MFGKEDFYSSSITEKHISIGYYKHRPYYTQKEMLFKILTLNLIRSEETNGAHNCNSKVRKQN